MSEHPHSFTPESHATRLDMDRDVRSYLDNLADQLEQDMAAVGVHSMKEFQNRERNFELFLKFPKEMKAMLKKWEHFVKVRKAEKIPEEIRVAISALNRIPREFQNFFEKTIPSLENQHEPWYTNLARIRAIAKAGEPKLAWDLYQKLREGVPDQDFASAEFDIPTVLSIYTASAHANVATISKEKLLEMFINWKAEYSQQHGFARIETRQRLLQSFFYATAGLWREEGWALENICKENLIHLSSLVDVIIWSDKFINSRAYIHTKNNFERHLSTYGASIRVEYFSKMAAKQGHVADRCDPVLIDQIESILADESRPPIVTVDCAIAYARLLRTTEAMQTYQKLKGPGNRSECAVGMAASYLEGPFVDIQEAKRALELGHTGTNTWSYARKEAVLRIIGPLLTYKEEDLAKRFVTEYVKNSGGQSAELLVQAVEYFTDFGLDATWAVSMFHHVIDSSEPLKKPDARFTLAEAETARLMRVWKRDISMIRELPLTEQNRLFELFNKNSDIIDGFALSVDTVRSDDVMRKTIQEHRRVLEAQYGKEFLDSLVYGTPI